MVTRSILFFLSLLPAPALASSRIQGVEVREKVEMAVPGGEFAPAGENRIVIASGRVRAEMGLTTHIYDATVGRYTVIRGRSRTWYSVPAAALAAQGAVPPAATVGLGVDPESGDPVVPAQVFAAISSDTVQTTRDFSQSVTRMRFDHGSRASWREMEHVVFDVFTVASSPLRAWLSQADALDGYPVEVESRGPRGRVRTTVISVRAIEVDEVEFEAPAGFRKVADPNRLTSAE